MNEIIVLLFIALSVISISVITYYHVRSHIRPHFNRFTSIFYGWFFSTVLFAYAYFGGGFLINLIRGDIAESGFLLVAIILTIVTGIILQAYLMYITSSKYRRLAYPIFYSVTPIGFFPLLWVLVVIHLALIFDFIYEQEKAKLD